MPSKASDISSPALAHTPTILVVLIVIIAVALPRFTMVGGLPTSDEGFYAYYAQAIQASLTAGRGLPDTGTLMLYPLLVNWVFSLNINSLVALRLVDMLVALLSGYALYRIIEVESRSRVGAMLIAGLFLFTMNQPAFIQYGFKNSIYAAYLPLFAALGLGLTADAREATCRWMGIGALLSLAVLLRETFLPFMVVGSLAVLASHGVRRFGQLILGAVGAGLLTVSVILAARGSIVGVYDGYRDASLLFAAVADKRVELFFSSGRQALSEAILPVIVASIGLIVTLIRSRSDKRITSWSKLGFWLAVTLVPLIEPALKIGFPYHFGVCLVGMAGLTCLGWRNVSERSSSIIWKYLTIGVLGIVLPVQIIPRLATLEAFWHQSREVLASSFKSRYWPANLTEKTNYLLAAKIIRQVTPPGGTVSISGFMYTLYPLTGYLPPKPEFANLSATMIKLGLSTSRLREMLLRCPPDVLMTTVRTEWPGASELLAAVRETGIYEQIADIPVSNDRAYGSFGGGVFRVTSHLPCK